MKIKKPQDPKQQLRQISEETLENLKKIPGEMAGQVMEQVGVGGGSQQPQQQQQTPTPDNQLEQMKTRDKQVSQQQVRALEAEINKLQQQREQAMRERRQVPVEPEEPAIKPIPELKSKRRRGILGGAKQIKSAQQASGAETRAARKVSG